MPCACCPLPWLDLNGGGGGDRFTFFWQEDFLGIHGASGIASPWYIDTNVDISFNTVNTDMNHPGVRSVNVIGNYAAGNGCCAVLSHVPFLLGGKEYCHVIFRSNELDSQRTWFGFLDSDTGGGGGGVLPPFDGAYFYLTRVGGVDGVIVGQTSTANVKSTTASSYTLTAATWYCARVVVNDDASIVTFEIYSEAGALLWSDTLNTNIPTAPGNDTGCGIVIINDKGSARTQFFDLDYIDVGMTRQLVR